MATEDLGSIATQGEAVQNPNDIDVLGGLARGAEAVIGMVKDGVINKEVEKLNEITDAAVDNEVLASTPDVLTVDPDASDADVLTNRITQLRAGIAQRSGSSKLRLQMELRAELEKSGQKFPGLRAELGTELGRFESTDPAFLLIGALDAAGTAASQDAQDELDLIRDTAYSSVSSGGLGMIPNAKAPFGSPAFSQEYAFQAALVSARNQNLVFTNAMSSQDNVDSRTSAANWDSYIEGGAAGVYAEIGEAREEWSRVALAMQDSTVPGALQTIALWEQGGQQATMDEIADAEANMQIKFGNLFPVNQVGTPDYEKAKTKLDLQMAAFGILKEGVANSDANLIRTYETFEAMKSYQWELDNPVVSDQIRVIKEITPILDAIDDTFSARGDLVRNRIGEFLDTSLPGLLSRTIGMTNLDALSPDATAQDVRDHFQSGRAGNPSRYGNGQTSPRGTQGNASADASLRFSPEFLGQHEIMTPTVASSVIGAAVVNAMDILETGAAPVDAARAMYAEWGQDGVTEVLAKAMLDRPAVVQAAGDELEKVARVAENQRRNEYRALKGRQARPGIFAETLLNFTVDEKTGDVLFMVDDDAINHLGLVTELQNKDVALPEFSTSPNPKTEQIIAREAAKAVARELTLLVSTDLKAARNIEAAQNGGVAGTFTDIWNNGGFKGSFGEIEE
jgi:hypothetical protein